MTRLSVLAAAPIRSASSLQDEGRQPRLLRSAVSFSLIEVLVALTIVAVALVACVRAAGQLVTNHAMMTERAWALISAQNTMADIRVQRIYPALGKTSQRCPQGRMVLVCEQDVEATANEGFRNVTVRVSRQGDNRMLSELRALASAPP